MVFPAGKPIAVTQHGRIDTIGQTIRSQKKAVVAEAQHLDLW
jgi:hypothetical protein